MVSHFRTAPPNLIRQIAVYSIVLTLILTSFPSRVVAVPLYQISDNATAQGLDIGTFLPINRTDNFKSTDVEVVSWLKFTNVYSPSHLVNFVWLTPQGYAYWKPNYTIPDPGPGRYYGTWDVAYYLAVRGSSAALMPGTWHIAIYVDGTLALTQNFTMTSQVSPTQSPWVNIGPQNIADDLSGSCYTTGNTVPCSSLVTAGKAAAFAYDPSFPATMYLSCDGGASAGAGCSQGVFKSTDSGTTWQAVDKGFTDNSARGLAVKHGNPNLVVALTSFAVFRTTDGGADWNQTYNGAAFTGVTLYQTSNDTLYIGTSNGILKSADFGSTWTTLSTFSVNQNEEVRALAVTNGGVTIYAELYIGQRTGEVMKSTDGGRTYSPSNTFTFGLPTGVHGGQVIPSPGDPSTLWVIAFYDYGYSSLLVSHDGGSTFQTVDLSTLGITHNGPLIASQYMMFDPRNQNIAFIAGDGYLFKSTNGGSSFSPIRLYPDVRFITVDSVNDNTVFVGSDQGLFRSDDGGTTWTGLNSGRSTTEIFSVGALGGRIFAVGQDFGEINSCDGGATWVNDLGSSCLSFSSYGAFHEWGTVGVNPYNSSNVILFTAGTGDYTTSSCSGKVLYSTDGGKTFALSQFSTAGLPCPDYYPAKPIIFDSSSHGTAYLGGGEGVYETTNYGATWALLRGSPTAAFLATTTVNPRAIYASSSAGLYRSGDGGGTWSLVNDLSFLTKANLTANLFWIAADPLNESVVAGVALNSNAVALSSDGGQTFKLTYPVQGNFPGYIGDLSISFLSVAGKADMILTGNMGVLVSQDQGGHWSDFTANLPRPYPGVTSLYLASDGTAYASTDGSGVWSYKGFAAALQSVITTTTSTSATSVTTSSAAVSSSSTSTTQAVSSSATTSNGVTSQSTTSVLTTTTSSTAPQTSTASNPSSISATTSSGTTTASSTSTEVVAATTTGNSGIPEFPFQLTAVAIMSSMIIISYLVLRRRKP